MKKLLMFVVVLLSTQQARADGISIDSFLETVRARHPLFAMEQMQPSIDQKTRESYLGREDWMLESAPFFKHQEPPERGPFEPERIDYLQLNARASRAFWQNGSRLSVGWSSDWTDQELPGFSLPGPGGSIDIPLSPSTYYQHSLNATWSLPLLKNRSGSLDRLQYELSAFDVDLSEVRSWENQEGFLLEVGLRFIDWALIDEQLSIGRSRFQLAEEELDRTRKKFKSRLVDEADVLRAENAVHATRAALLQMESLWKSVQAELATVAQSTELYSSAPDFDLYDLPTVPAVDDAVAYALGRSRVLRTVDIQRGQLQALQSGLEEQKRPDLALSLTGALIGGSNEFDRSLEIVNPDVMIALELKYPLGNRTARADVEKAQLQLRQLNLARQDAALQIEANLRALVVQLEQLRVAMQEDEMRIETARRKTLAEQDIYRQGRGDLTFVIQSRDGEAVAKLDHAEKSALYQKLVMRYRSLTDDLLPSDLN